MQILYKSSTSSFLISLPFTGCYTYMGWPGPVFWKRGDSRREMGNKTEFETRNGREMGNETEFEMRNGREWETRRYKIHHFSTKKQEKQGKKWKTGEKNTEQQEKTGTKTEIYKKYRNKISTRFLEMLKTETSFRRDFGKCWKRKREQKQGLLECHETTIREQKRCIVPPLGSP